MDDNTEDIQAIFPPAISQQIRTAIHQHPDLRPLFHTIATYVRDPASLKVPIPSHPALDTSVKKRKLDELDSGVNGHSIANATTTFDCKDVSFQVPARKKLRLQLVSDARDAQNQEIRLLDQKTANLELSIPSTAIEAVFCLPVPEKQQRQWNFVVFPKEGSGCEQLVCTMAETPPTGSELTGHTMRETDTFVTVAELAFNRLLQPVGKQVEIPDANEFVSSMPQPHRKGEMAWHVKGFRGSKDGYLFFLPPGIVFGFKKPLAFFPFERIESISYTSVLQRTFNLVISVRQQAHPSGSAGSEAAEEVKEIELSMLDQIDFAGIDEYIKRHGLNDASMAAERRAKAYNVNKPRGAEVNGAEAGAGQREEDDGRTELERAEQQLQDEEDEEDEDYVVSGGESEGEGEDSEEDEEAEGYEEAGDGEEMDDEAEL